ncbi:MAG: hypothetical protein COB41_03440 [Proteobacteria bacterium]|nr:MAG: hypothetical protein COB41_03440 [Pseudomonadota bacterium]
MADLSVVAQKLCELLGDSSVLIGGMCAIAHGSERVTQDVDLATQLSLKELSEYLDAQHITYTVEKGDWDDRLTWVLHGEMDGIAFQILPAADIGVDVAYGIESNGIRLASLECFLTSKCIAGSHQDLYDIAVIVLRSNAKFPEITQMAQTIASKHGCLDALNDWLMDERLMKRYSNS